MFGWGLATVLYVLPVQPLGTEWQAEGSLAESRITSKRAPSKGR